MSAGAPDTSTISNMDRCWNILTQRTLSTYLTAQDVISLVVVSKMHHFTFSSNEIWKDFVFSDFQKRDQVANRSPGYHKNLYLAILEERIAEHNLITGGH